MRAVQAAILFSILAGCDSGTPIDSGESFPVAIVSQDGKPVEGATIRGGIDWDYYSKQTNASGLAMLPRSARSQPATIFKTNHIPLVVDKIGPIQLTLNETLQRLELIGNVSGRAIRFRPGELLTLDYSGYYHLYSYNSRFVSELFSQKLADSATAIREMQLFGDTLWFTTHNAGVYVFLISDPAAPRLLFHLAIPGYLGPFVRMDSILILGDRWSPGPLRIFSYSSSGQFHELSSVRDFLVLKMGRAGSAVVLLGNGESPPMSFDISNPAFPKMLYTGLEWGNQSGFFYDRYTILGSAFRYGGANLQQPYVVLDFSNPSNPARVGVFGADSWVSGLASENLAYGNHYNDVGTISVMAGSMFGNFKTVATISEDGTIDSVVGSFPPYFIIANKLWRLVDR